MRITCQCDWPVSLAPSHPCSKKTPLGRANAILTSVIDGAGCFPDRHRSLRPRGSWLAERFLRHRGNADLVRWPTRAVFTWTCSCSKSGSRLGCGSGSEGASRYFDGRPRELLIDNARVLVSEHHVQTREMPATTASMPSAATGAWCRGPAHRIGPGPRARMSGGDMSRPQGNVT